MKIFEVKTMYTLTLLCLYVSAQAQLQFEAPAQTDPPGATVSGQVFTTDGRMAAGVNVVLNPGNRGATTDDNGYFLFSNLPKGSYVLAVSMTGLKPQQKQLIINGHEKIEVTLTLEEDNRQLTEVVIRTRKNLNTQPLSIGKIDIAPMNLPQSVAVIGQQTIRDQQALRLSDVIRNVNGVYLSSTRAGTQENFAARGYSFSSSNLFKNGARVNSGAMPEMSSLERVEVLKGSAAILFGNVAPGGIVNMVTKQPGFDWGGEVSMRLGSYNLYKPAFDVYGPLSSHVAFRFNGTYENAASYRHEVESQRQYINPSFLFKFSRRTELLVQGDYLRHDFTPDFGIGSLDNTRLSPLTRGTYPGAAWSYAHTRQTTASAVLKHRFSENWKLTASTSFQRYTRDYYSTERIQAAANGAWARPLGRTDTRENYFLSQFDLTGKFSTGNIGHQFLGGIDGDSYLTTAYSFNQPAFYDTVNILDERSYQLRNDIPDAFKVKSVKTPVLRFGVYAQDLISFGTKWKLLAGIRWSYQEGRPALTTDLLSGVGSSGQLKVDKAFSPRLGIVYRPTKTLSLFTSYSNSFSINSGTDVNGAALPPSLINQLEAGIKNEWFDGRFTANVTAYRIKNNNLAQMSRFAADGVTLNNNTNLKELTGETTSDGLELDLEAHPFIGFNMSGGYSYNFMRYTKTSGFKGSFVEGERLIGTPAHTANASIFYSIRKGKFKNLRLGATAVYTGRRWAGFNNTVGQTQNYNRLFVVDGYSTIDLNAGYLMRSFSVMLKLSNICNTLNYYVHENYSVNPIPPRQLSATFAYRF